MPEADLPFIKETEPPLPLRMGREEPFPAGPGRSLHVLSSKSVGRLLDILELLLDNHLLLCFPGSEVFPGWGDQVCLS